MQTKKYRVDFYKLFAGDKEKTHSFDIEFDIEDIRALKGLQLLEAKVFILKKYNIIYNSKIHSLVFTQTY